MIFNKKYIYTVNFPKANSFWKVFILQNTPLSYFSFKWLNFIKTLIFILVILQIYACRKAPEGFDMSYRRQFNLLAGLSTFQSHNFEFKDIAADTSVFFNLYNVKSNDIPRIIPKSMNLRAVFASADTRYNFINKVEVWISNPADATMTPQVIFFRDDVPLNTDSRLDLIPNNVDIKKFIVAGRFNLRINLKMREFTTRTIETEWNTVFLAESIL